MSNSSVKPLPPLPPPAPSGCNDLIARITNAIIRQEGAPSTSTNPGNLRACPWLKGPWAEVNGFWLPVSRATGIAGLAQVVALHIAEGDSLEGFISGRPGYPGFAPEKDHNEPETYIRNVMQWAKIPNSTSPLQEFMSANLP